MSQLALNLYFSLNDFLTWFVNAMQGSNQISYSYHSSVTKVANATHMRWQEDNQLGTWHQGTWEEDLKLQMWHKRKNYLSMGAILKNIT